MDEGAMLAFKQSEMEKTVRKARGALRGVQEERDNLAKVSQDRERGVFTYTPTYPHLPLHLSPLYAFLNLLFSI